MTEVKNLWKVKGFVKFMKGQDLLLRLAPSIKRLESTTGV